jgi:diguanylate cyclase (GGDEF)-like protein
MSKKYSFLLENLMGYAALAVLNFTFFESAPAFNSIVPHPYWFMILLVATRYGVLPGMLTGAVGACIYSYWIWVSGLPTADGLSYFVQAFLFAGGGGLLGIIGLHHKSSSKMTTGQAGEFSLTTLRNRREAILKVKETKTRPIEISHNLLVEMIRQIGAIQNKSTAEILTEIPAMMNRFLGAECSSFYEVRQDTFELIARQDDIGRPRLADSLPIAYNPLARSLKSKTISGLSPDVSQREFNHAEVIVCSPLFKKNGSPTGILVIEQMPPDEFSENRIRLFKAFAASLPETLERSRRHQQQKDHNIVDEVTGACSYMHFQKRLHYEIRRARRFETDLSLLLLDIDGFEKLDIAIQDTILVAMDVVFSSNLREIDIIAKYKTPGSFAIILPGQSKVEAESILARLIEAIDRYEFRPVSHSGIDIRMKAGLSAMKGNGGGFKSLTEAAEHELNNDTTPIGPESFNDLVYLMPPSDPGAVISNN